MTGRGRPGIGPKGLAAALAVAVAALLPLLAGCSRDDGTALPPPDPAETTTTTEPVDLTQVSLAPISVEGKATSTTRPLGGGKAAIFGRVVDADGGVVPGALVRATYYGDPDKPEVIEALSGGDGGYRFERVLGGRWRIRAWRAPDLATLDDHVFFLGYTEQRQVDLKVKAASDIVVTSSMAPNPPFVGSPVELALLVLTQSVDQEGMVHRAPVGGAAVTLTVSGNWSISGDPTQATDDNGRVAWVLTCNEVGDQPISAFVGTKDWPLRVPGCRDPMETSTTTATTLPPGETTTSTKPKPKPKPATTTSSTRPPSYATTSTRARSSSR